MNPIAISSYFTFKSFAKESALLGKLKLSKNERLQLESMTQEQNGNVVWHMARKCRLTASNFGRVVQNGDVSFLTCDGDGSKKKLTIAMRWGLLNESKARDLYAQKHGVLVDKIGLLISESGILGGTPDGIVKSKRVLLEIKCPFTLSLKCNKGKLMNLIKAGKYWLKLDKDGNVDFNMSHKQGIAYYHQIQGCLYLAGELADSCDLVVWGPSDWLEINVKKNEDWFICYGSYLEHFWRVRAAPEICKQELRMVSTNTVVYIHFFLCTPRDKDGKARLA